MERDTYKKLATRQHRLIMLMLERGLFPDIEPKDKRLMKAAKRYAKECLNNPLVLKVMHQ